MMKSRQIKKSKLVDKKPRFERVVAFMLVVSLNALGLFGVGGTLGYYQDTESTTDNLFKAGEIDFSLAVSGFNSTTTAISMAPHSKVKKFVEVKPGESNPFFYYASTTNFMGDEDFCSGLKSWADVDGNVHYDGSLNEMKLDKSIQEPNSSTTTWRLTFRNENNLANRVCNFDIDINGWQTRHDFEEFGDLGYTDKEKFNTQLSTWGFRINKVYYDVSEDRGEEGVNEWVEIYNQTDSPQDLSGWQICDNTSCDTLPLTPHVPAHGYAIIVATTTTASKDIGAYWYLPDEVVKIDLNDLIGNGLSNDEDMLMLKRSDGAVIDEMNWGTPNESWNNYHEGLWNEGAEDASDGSLLARKLAGYDTDTTYEWRVFTPPELNLIQPESGGTYTWYWEESHAIEWLAKNKNGLHEDLNISIFYTKDENHDDVISNGDTTHLITKDTENDGIFDWVIPTGFEGEVWIQLVATGPENPMMNTVANNLNEGSLFTLFVEEEESVDIQPLSMMMALPLVAPEDDPVVKDIAPTEPEETLEEEILIETPTATSEEAQTEEVKEDEVVVEETLPIEDEPVIENVVEESVEPKMEEKVEEQNVEEEKIEEPAKLVEPEPVEPTEEPVEITDNAPQVTE